MTSLLTIRQAAALLSLSPSFLYQLVNQGKVPYLRFGTTIRFRPESLEAWIAGQEQARG